MAHSTTGWLNVTIFDSGHGIHNLVSVDGIKKSRTLRAVVKKARNVCKTVRYRAPDLEREKMAEEESEWLQSVIDADMHQDVDDMDPIPDGDGDALSDADAHSDDDGEVDFDRAVRLPRFRAPTSVKLPVPTRWHTTLIMLESMDQNKVNLHSKL